MQVCGVARLLSNACCPLSSECMSELSLVTVLLVFERRSQIGRRSIDLTNWSTNLREKKCYIMGIAWPLSCFTFDVRLTTLSCPDIVRALSCPDIVRALSTYILLMSNARLQHQIGGPFTSRLISTYMLFMCTYMLLMSACNDMQLAINVTHRCLFLFLFLILFLLLLLFVLLLFFCVVVCCCCLRLSNPGGPQFV